MKISMLVMILLLGVAGIADAACSNNPPGSTELTSFPFSARDGSGWFSDYPGGGNLVSDSGDPVSPSSVLEYTWQPANGSGQNLASYSQSYYPVNKSEVYVCFQWKPSNPFTGWQTNQNKIHLIDTPGQGHGYLLFTDVDGTHDGGPYSVNLQTGWNVSNAHICGGTVCNLLANTGGNATVNLGSFQEVEYYLKASTCQTCQNGVVKVWLRGTLILNYSNVNTRSTFGNIKFTPVWDAPRPPCSACPGNTTQDSHRFGHALITAPNCVSNCGGGGDTTPPSVVNGVTVASTTATSVGLSWSAASDNVGVAGYDIERCSGIGCSDFSSSGNSSATATTITGLSPSTSYSFRLKARDSAGNVSTSYSAPVTTTTLSQSLPTISTLTTDATGADVTWTGSPASIRVITDTLNIVEPISAFVGGPQSIAHVQSQSTTGTGNTAILAYTSNNTVGCMLGLRYRGTAGVTITSATDSRGNTWTTIPSATGGTGLHQAMRYAKNCAAGANTVTVNLSGTATYELDILEYSGVDVTAPLDQSTLNEQTNPGTSSNAVTTGNVTTTVNGELTLGATSAYGISTTYNANSQFSGTQGQNQWYYKDSTGTNLTWNGSYYLSIDGNQSIWASGFHPGDSTDTVRRWVAPQAGSLRITGHVYDGNTSCGTDGVLYKIKKNGTDLYSQTIAAGDTTGYNYDVTTTVAANDEIDFRVNLVTTSNCDSTVDDPTIVLTDSTSTSAGTGYTSRQNPLNHSPVEDKVQSTAGSVSATFTSNSTSADYISSMATFKPATGTARYSRQWTPGTTFACFRAIDSLGNENTNPDDYRCAAVTPSSSDTTAPTRSNSQPTGTLAAGTTSTMISVSTNEAATCKYSTTAGTAYGSMTNTLAASQISTFHSGTVSGLSNGTTYNYYVRCQDVVGNVNTSDTTITFSIASSPGDTTAPSQVTDLTGQAISPSQVSLSWTAATDNVGVTGYEIHGSESGGTFTLMDTATGTSTVVSSLAQNRTYTFKVRARDAVGNLGTFSNTVDVLTTVADTTPPSTMTGLTVTPVDFQTFDVSWTSGTDDSGVTATRIEQCMGATCTDFQLIGSITVGTTVRVTGLKPATTYLFRGKHADAAGNVSAAYPTPVDGTTLTIPNGTILGLCPCSCRAVRD